MATRSLGDRYFRPVGVISAPFTTHRAISGDDLLLISASDGLWDVMSNGEVRAMARKHPDPNALLSALKDEVLNYRSGGDNLTIIAVSLQ
jgi:serine/threonine protein phosphatase PrpC